MKITGIVLFVLTLTYLFSLKILERSIRDNFREYWRSLGGPGWQPKRLSDILSRRRLPSEIYEENKVLIVFVKILIALQCIGFPLLFWMAYLDIK